jgi:hypothetical protein
MSVPGGLIAGGGLPSPSVFNKKLNIVDTGTAIAAISSGSLLDGMVASCTADGGGLLGGIIYQRLTGTWIPVSMTQHDHSADTPAAGGRYLEVILNGGHNIIDFNILNATHNQFMLGGFWSSGGTPVTDIVDTGVDGMAPFVQISSSALSGSWAQGFCMMVPFALGDSARLWMALAATDGSHLVIRHGLNMESAQQSPVTSGSALGIEACDSAGTQKNYDFVSRTAGTRVPTTVSSSLAAVSQNSTFKSYEVQHLPAIPVSKLFIAGTLVSTKTTNVPNGTDLGLQYTTGILTNNTTAKYIRFVGTRIIGKGFIF